MWPTLVRSQSTDRVRRIGILIGFGATMRPPPGSFANAVTEGQGSVIFRVLADGKPLFTSDVVRGKTPPVVVGPLSVKDVNQLTLSVDFADHGDILDHADWCDAVLIRR